MASIRNWRLEDVITELPDIEPLDVAALSSEQGTDLFIAVLGFEDRSLEIPQILVRSGFKARHAISLEYATNVNDNASNRPVLLQCMRQISPQVTSLEVDVPGFGKQLGDIIGALSTTERSIKSVVLDISVAANRLVMRCINVILTQDVSLKVVYSEAAIYHPTRAEYDGRDQGEQQASETLGLELGVGDVAFSEEYPGYHLDPLPDCVIVFPSYNRTRARTVISHVDPSLAIAPAGKVIWMLGLPHQPEDSWRLEAMRTINGIEPDAPQYNVSTFDYKESLRTLENIYVQKSSDFKFTLSPMGSKLQALGATLFCFLHPDVRVVSAIPKMYNAFHYSEGCRAVWALDFGSAKDLLTLLNKVGTLEVIASVRE